MKRYQAFLGPIVLSLVVWAAGWRYCVANADRGCDKPTQDVVTIVSCCSTVNLFRHGLVVGLLLKVLVLACVLSACWIDLSCVSCTAHS